MMVTFLLPWLCYLGIKFALQAIVAEGADSSVVSCNAAQVIALSKVALDLIVIEPETVANKEFSDLLNHHRSTRLIALREIVAEGFGKKSRIRMAQFRNGKPCVNLYSDTAEDLIKLTRGNFNTMYGDYVGQGFKAIRVALTHFTGLQSPPADDVKTLRVIVLLADQISLPTPDEETKPFSHHTTDATKICKSRLPTFRELGNIVARKGVSLLFVTPTLDVKDSCGTEFGPENVYFLDSNAIAMQTDERREEWESPEADRTIANFIHRRAVQLACSHFPGFVETKRHNEPVRETPRSQLDTESTATATSLTLPLPTGVAATPTIVDDAQNVWHKCTATHAIPLHNIDVDLVWMQPYNISRREPNAVKILNYEPDKRLLSLESAIRRVFRMSNVQVVEVTDNYDFENENSDGLSCLKRLPNVKASDALLAQTGATTRGMLLAATLAERYLEMPWTKTPAVSASESKRSRVLRIIVMFAEGWGNPEITSEMDRFSTDAGTNTCKSSYPSLSEAKQTLDARDIDLLLITPSEFVRTTWTATFKADNSLVFPTDNTFAKEFRSVLKREMMEAIPRFVLQRLQALACNRFPELLGSINTQKSGNSSTSRAPAMTTPETSEAVGVSGMGTKPSLSTGTAVLRPETGLKKAPNSVEVLAAATEALQVATKALTAAAQIVTQTSKATGAYNDPRIKVALYRTTPVDIDLDLVWIEPKYVGDRRYAQLLNDNRPRRSQHLSRRTRYRFRNVKIQMMQAVDTSSSDSSNLECVLQSPDLFLWGKQRTETKKTTNSMFLAAVLAAQNFKLPPTRDEASDSRNPVFRSIAMFVEDLPALTAPRQGLQFKGDGTDTCQSNYPQLEQLRDALDQLDVDVFLVTPSTELQAAWNTVFQKPDNCLLLQSCQKTSSPTHSRCNIPNVQGVIGNFVATRTITVALERFLYSIDG